MTIRAPSPPAHADLWRYRLVTSNPHKLAEFQRYGLACGVEAGRDLPEIASDAASVALYKGRDAGALRIVEDSSLDVEGAGIGVDVRWQLALLQTLVGARAVWTALMAVNDGTHVHLYRGVTKGRIVAGTIGPDDFGFEPIFVPDGARCTLSELARQGKKDPFSARYRAVRAVLAGEACESRALDDLPDWTGAWQEAI